MSKLYLLSILVILMASAFAAPSADEKAAKKDHPGCLVWWFAPKCPLAKVFGVDPLKIYPWGKFCKIYSAFQDAEVCQDHIDINMPKMSKRSANEGNNDGEEASPAWGNSHTHDPHQRGGDVAKLMELCANDESFANLHQQLCSGAAHARHRRQSGSVDHPGCLKYFFLPDCPLAAVFGVDPLKHYPWNELCQYRSLSSRFPCNYVPVADAVLNEIQEAGNQGGKGVNDQLEDVFEAGDDY